MKSISTLAIKFALLTSTVATAASIHHEWSRRAELSEDPVLFTTCTQMITSKGFPCENHYVTTEDGYILNVLRIPHGRNGPTSSGGPKPVVVLQHGLLGSCMDFLVNPVNESLAYILADAGAEVWLGNNRGNFYSRNHTYLKTTQEEFWDFSFDEMAKYDLPTTINYVTATAGVEQVFYIGYSQGTTLAFIGFGENQELASKVKHFIALAPVARAGHTKSPIAKLLTSMSKVIQIVNELFGRGELYIGPPVMQWIATKLCDGWGITICQRVLFLFGGFNEKSMNKTRIPFYVAHYPLSTSVKGLIHWFQGVRSNKFQAYDYMSAHQNINHYGQPNPPLYDPKKVKVPVTIFRGGNDWLADPADVSWLLPQLNISIDVNIDYYEHLDFIWAMDAPTVIYSHLLKVVFSYV